MKKKYIYTAYHLLQMVENIRKIYTYYIQPNGPHFINNQNKK